MTFLEQADIVAGLLYRFDPIGLAAVGCQPDEYEPEAETILPRLHGCTAPEDVQTVVYEEFCQWFNKSGVHGPREAYVGVSVAIWNWWRSRAMIL